MKNFQILEANSENTEKVNTMHNSQSFLEDCFDGEDFKEACLKKLTDGMCIDSGVFVNRKGQFYATVLNKHKDFRDMKILFHIVAETDDERFVAHCASQDK